MDARATGFTGGMSPSDPALPSAPGAPVRLLELAVRHPFDGEGLAHWFGDRALPGVEQVDGTCWARAVRLPHGPAVLAADLAVPAGQMLPVSAHLSDVEDAPHAARMARRLLDLDADPQPFERALRESTPALEPLFDARPGVRIPGSESLAEAILWAVAGQQVTTVQTREQLTRAADLVSDPLPEALRGAGRRGTGRRGPALERLAPDPLRAAERAEEWFRGPGARRRALQEAVPAAAGLEREAWLPGGDAPADDISRPGIAALRTRLLALRGIGPWTADYALMRGAGAPDLAPARDAALLAAARDLDLAQDHAELTAVLETARPWRSTSVMHLWQHAAHRRTRPSEVSRSSGPARRTPPPAPPAPPEESR